MPSEDTSEDDDAAGDGDVTVAERVPYGAGPQAEDEERGRDAQHERDRPRRALHAAELLVVRVGREQSDVDGKQGQYAG